MADGETLDANDGGVIYLNKFIRMTVFAVWR